MGLTRGGYILDYSSYMLIPPVPICMLKSPSFPTQVEPLLPSSRMGPWLPGDAHSREEPSKQTFEAFQKWHGLRV